MTNSDEKHKLALLKQIATKSMLEHGLLPEFSSQVFFELQRINSTELNFSKSTRDLRDLAWCSIDNSDSMDLDQLTYAIKDTNDSIKILIAIADVDSLVKKNSQIDTHAQYNTCTVYTDALIFPMLPEKLSTFLTSLSINTDRPALVFEIIIDSNGQISNYEIYRALVHNYAKLEYDSLSQWLEGKIPILKDIDNINHLSESLLLQDDVAQKLKALRHSHGALDLNITKGGIVVENDEIIDFKTDYNNRAKDIIADLMIVTNTISTFFLNEKKYPSLRRVVRIPKRWDRIVALALEHDYLLPVEPDSKALEEFLLTERKKHPDSLSDLSLSIVKLLGSGEYIVEEQGDQLTGHFGLAVKEYSHSTAPNRRFPDLVTQRLLKAALIGDPVPYKRDKLEEIANHCTKTEDIVKKVERQVNKSALAMLMESKIGEQFESIVTGASPKGVWVRLLSLPVEGKLLSGGEDIDVGYKLRVELIHIDIERGFIDFKRV